MAKQTQNTTAARQPEMQADSKGGLMKIAWIGVLALLLYLPIYNFLPASDNADDTKESSTSYTEAEAEMETPAFNANTWFSGRYQDRIETYLKADSKIGSKLTPLKNQLDFDLFREYNVEDYIRGNKDFLISEQGIYSYLGKDFSGDSVVNEKVRKLKVVADTLKSKGIDLIVLCPPTKEYAMPELIPAKYLQYKKRRNNYEAYLEGFKKAGITHLDLLPFVQKLKEHYPYPIYPQYGTHMSYFTEYMVGDLTIKFIESLCHQEIPHISYSQIDYPREPLKRDVDGIRKANLKTMPEGLPLAYPIIRYMPLPTARPVKTLGIGDSYYRGFLYLGITKIPFDKGEYWYYYNSIYTESEKSKKEVWEYDLKTKLEENKVIILYYSTANLYRLGDGFIEDAYELYTSPASYHARVKKERSLKMKMKLVHNDPDLLYEAEGDAKKLNMPLDSAIKLKAASLLK